MDTTSGVSCGAETSPHLLQMRRWPLLLGSVPPCHHATVFVARIGQGSCWKIPEHFGLDVFIVMTGKCGEQHLDSDGNSGNSWECHQPEMRGTP